MSSTQLLTELGAAVRANDYRKACECAAEVAMAGEAAGIDVQRRALELLRKKRWFEPMRTIAQALLRAGVQDANVHRQFAQAYIEQTEYASALSLLDVVIASQETEKSERIECLGLRGRVFKQQYVEGGQDRADLEQLMLEALQSYRDGLELSEGESRWHAINIVSLLQRATRDGLTIQGAEDPLQLAQQILADIGKISALEAWDLATAAEACVALDKFEDASDWIERYAAHPKADHFELTSTIRQFDEVLQRGDHILVQRMREENLRRTGGSFVAHTLKEAQQSRSLETKDNTDARIPLLLRVSEPEWQPTNVPDLVIMSRVGTIIGAMGTSRSVEAVLADPNVLAIEGSRANDRTEAIARLPTGLQLSFSAPGKPACGKAIVAVIDTGIDLLHTSFLDENGRSRVIAFWDQTDNTGPEPWPGAGGTLHSEEQIHGYVKAKEVPHRLGRDRRWGGHGTHVASLAAGRPFGDFPGSCAPGAKIVVVLSQTSVEERDPHSIGYSLGHVGALHFIDKTAKEQDLPVVVNISQGENSGAHDGTSLLEAAIDEFTQIARAPGRVVIKSAGNDRAKEMHACVQLAEQPKAELRWNVVQSRVGHVLEGWFDSSNEVEFQLVDPSGAATTTISLSNPEVSGEFDSGNTYQLSLTGYHRDNGDSRLAISIGKGKGSAVVGGTWALKIASAAYAEGPLHAWVEGGGRKAPKFETHVDETLTLSIPGTANTVISVAALERHDDGRLTGAPFSSVGPTRDNRYQPDVGALGVAVLGADSNTDEGSVPKDGTSMAAPQVAGVVAQLLAHDPTLTASQVRKILRNTTRQKWAATSGCGLVDVEAAMAVVARALRK